jgi:single-stranded-DNA-specific exonuclease
MAAVGVVFLFVVALNNILRSLGFYKDKSEPNLIRYLDLVAFGTVCDVVKLSGVNRLFVKSGLNQMRLGQNKGLAALAQLVGLEEAPSAYHLGYVFGPRINACGRVGKSDIGMRLLSTDDEIEAAALAQILEDLNMTRRDIEAAVLHAATEQVEHRMADDPFIVVQGEDWHQGVVGIVAGRLKDKYNLPVFALSIEGDEVKGSSRSVQGVDLGTLVMNAIERKILSRGGGHPMAAGFSLIREKLGDFYDYLKEKSVLNEKVYEILEIKQYI